MQWLDGRPVYSATDLVGFLACGHLTNLDRAAIARLVAPPQFADPELDRIAERGLQHERRFLTELQAEGLAVSTIETDGSTGTRQEQLVQAATETVDAMREGVDVIYQATFFDGVWRGHADFLRKVATPSLLGDWSYEVWDTKLARHTKGSAILQLCMYTHLLTDVQGTQPEYMHVALGGSAHEIESHRYADYAAYFRLVRSEFLELVAAGEAVYPPVSRPEPVEHCGVCRWDPACRDARREADDLSLVAGITAHQRGVLRERGVATRTALSAVPLPFNLEPPLKPSARASMARIREQARLQVAGEEAGGILFELLEPARRSDDTLEPNRGLLILPEPSPGDLFFDMEGDPFALEDGVDYLFGVLEPGLRDANDAPTFHRFWSIDDSNNVTFEAERRAFEAFIDFVMARLETDPNLHVYHYAPYEPTALRRLMGRYGAREAEVDQLLRAGTLVDLFRTVRQGVRASVESYSIKKLEPLYGFTREIELRDAGSSIVAFETWLELAGDVPDDPHILDRIEAYNRDDCVSTWLLRDWLEQRRGELVLQLGTDPGRPQPQASDPAPELSAALVAVQSVVDRLVDGVPEAESSRTPSEHARWLLAQLLHWHRREDKSDWWRYFYLLGLTDDELVDETDALGSLTYEGPVGTEKRSTIYRFGFPVQEHKIAPGTDVRDPHTLKSPGTVVAIDDEHGWVDIRRGTSSGPPEATALVPYGRQVSNDVQRKSLLRVGEWVADHDVGAPGPYRAACDLLLRQAPRVGEPGGVLTAPGELARDAARRLVLRLDETCLAVQGPPGSGKTSVGAEMIVDLVESGKQVGVTANSHQVIGNLLHEAALAADRRGVSLRIGQKPGTDEEPTCPGATALDNDGARNALENGEVDLLGGTAWLWSREDMAGLADVLFVDEAGQLSLANTVAVAPAAQSLVLLGDPQQLEQPLKGTHPPGAERSALGHLLGVHATMPPELGLFLGTTWRLHPDICSYTSEVFYEGRLTPEPGRELQRVEGVAPLSGTGIRFMGIEHFGHTGESDEEAAAVAHLVEALLGAGATWMDDGGNVHALTPADVLIVTPYNAQAGAIRQALPTARVGTVDKFQGQQGPIAIYSMATSSAADAPRGMEFLYDLHRLNVATSRARCLAMVVANPELLRVRCRTPRQMRLANAFARLLEVASVS